MGFVKTATRVAALVLVVGVTVVGTAHLDIDTADDDGGCVLGLPMCRGIGSGAGDPIWTNE